MSHSLSFLLTKRHDVPRPCRSRRCVGVVCCRRTVAENRQKHFFLPSPPPLPLLQRSSSPSERTNERFPRSFCSRRCARDAVFISGYGPFASREGGEGLSQHARSLRDSPLAMIRHAPSFSSAFFSLPKEKRRERKSERKGETWREASLFRPSSLLQNDAAPYPPRRSKL